MTNETVGRNIEKLLKQLAQIEEAVEETKQTVEDLRDSIELESTSTGDLRDRDFVKKLVEYVKRNGPCTERQLMKVFKISMSERGRFWHMPLKMLTHGGVLAHNYGKTRDEPYYFVRDLTEDDLATFAPQS